MITTVESQHMAALAKGNTIRLHVARYKRHLAALSMADAALSLAEVLEEPIVPGRLREIDGPLGAAHIGALLRAIHRMGEAKAAAMLREAGIASDGRRLRELTRRQRGALARELRHIPAVREQQRQEAARAA